MEYSKKIQLTTTTIKKKKTKIRNIRVDQIDGTTRKQNGRFQSNLSITILNVIELNTPIKTELIRMEN